MLEQLVQQSPLSWWLQTACDFSAYAGCTMMAKRSLKRCGLSWQTDPAAGARQAPKSKSSASRSSSSDHCSLDVSPAPYQHAAQHLSIHVSYFYKITVVKSGPLQPLHVLDLPPLSAVSCTKAGQHSQPPTPLASWFPLRLATQGKAMRPLHLSSSEFR